MAIKGDQHNFMLLNIKGEINQTEERLNDTETQNTFINIAL